MMLPMKILETLLIFFLYFFVNISSFKFTTSSTFETSRYRIIQNFTLSEGPIYAKTWLKYTSFVEESKNKPKEFFKNAAFYEQMKSGATLDLTKKDDIGYVNIPDEEHFFFILTENTLNVLSSRKNNLARTVDVLNIDEILNNTNCCNFDGGVVDHGDFLEGFCFQIKYKNEKNQNDEVWEVCADNKKDKVLWMNTLIKLVQKINKKSPELMAQENNMKKVIDTLKKGISNSTLAAIKNTKKITWIPITVWSDCSKPCGGGKSFLQRLCILGNDSKEKCTGERVLTKNCNLQPCDGSENEIARIKKLSNETLAHPVIRNLPISRRPLRYERCIIKEGDLSLYIDSGALNGAKVPVRVILNNRTLTAYSNDEYESIILSHRLSTITGLKPYDKEPSKSCFQIEESKKKSILCTFVSSGKSLPDLAKEWQSDILDFIKNCANYYSHELDYKEMNDFNLQKVQDTLDFYQEKEKDQMEKIILKTQQLALQAIEKELKVENLIEKEEEEKEKKLEEDVNKEYDKIKMQKEYINQALVEKKKQADIYNNKLMIKKKIKQITEQVKREVTKIREDLRARIISKKRDEKRKRELVLNKITTLRKDISKNLLKASKNGNYEECNPERPTKQIIEYCKVNYETDYTKMNDCVKNDNFCYMCCESEYGDLHLESRSNCYTKCDDYYIYKIKFQPSDNLKLNLDVTPYGVKTNDVVEAKKAPINPPSINNKELYYKFLETKVKTQIHENSDLKEANENSSSQDINKLIEEEKKRELLMNIKEELNLE